MIIGTGFHGSGTSSIIIGLQALGIDFPGPHDCPEQHEFLGARAVNERMLFELVGHNWMIVPEYAALVKYPTERVNMIPDVNWKDPRGCLTLPVWRNKVDKVIWIKRNPLNVSKTINRIHGLPKYTVLQLIGGYEYILYRTLLEFNIPYIITVYESWYKEKDVSEVGRVLDFCAPGSWPGTDAVEVVLNQMRSPQNI